MGALASGSSGGGSGQRKLGSASGGGSGSSGSVSPALSGSMSQPPPRFDHHTDMMTILQYASPTMAASMEGFIKGLHNKFQIPKLSQRGSGGNTTSGRSTPSGSSEPALAGTSSSILGPIASSTGLTEPEAKPPVPPSQSGNEGLLNLSSTAGTPSADGIDEELLASLAGE